MLSGRGPAAVAAGAPVPAGGRRVVGLGRPGGGGAQTGPVRPRRPAPVSAVVGTHPGGLWCRGGARERLWLFGRFGLSSLDSYETIICLYRLLVLSVSLSMLLPMRCSFAFHL